MNKCISQNVALVDRSFHCASSSISLMRYWSCLLCRAFNRSPTTWHGVTQRGRTPTRSSPTTTTLTLNAITPDTTACLRTSLARANQSWWHQKIRAVCVEINNRPLAFLPALCCHQSKATAKVEHQTRAANKALIRTVCRHKLDTAFTFVFLWMGPLSTLSSFTWEVRHFQDQFLVHDHYKETKGGLHVTLIQFILQRRKNIFIQLASQIFLAVSLYLSLVKIFLLLHFKTHCTISSRHTLYIL